MRRKGAPPEKKGLQLVRDEVSAFVGKAPKKRVSGAGLSDKRFLKLLDEVEAFLAAGSWKGAEGKHFVALYADLHFRVYGIAPADLAPKERLYASGMAKSLLAKEFGGDRDEMSRFVAWTWTREKERERWRRENGRDGQRIDWRLQFGTRLLVDFRLAEARRKTGS